MVSNIKFKNKKEYEKWKAEKLNQNLLKIKENKTNRKTTFFEKLLRQVIPQQPKEESGLIDFLKLHAEVISQNGTDKDEIPGGFGDFGSLSNPIPVRGIIGTHEYLNNLTTINGQEISFVRLGSTSAENIENPIDIYEIYNTNRNLIKRLYISIYHKKNSCRVPSGFKFKSSIRGKNASDITDYFEGEVLPAKSLRSKKIKDMFKEIIELGRKQGVLTYEDINELLPTDYFCSPDDLEDLMETLQAMGVKVIETPELEEDSKERKLGRLLAESILDINTSLSTQGIREIICYENNPSEIEIIRTKFNLCVYGLATFIRYINLFGNMFEERNRENSLKKIINYLYCDFNDSIDQAFKNYRPKIVDIVVDASELTEISKKIGNDVHPKLSTGFKSLLSILLDKRLQQYMTAFNQLTKNNISNSTIFPPVKVFFKHLTGDEYGRDEYGKQFSVYISPSIMSLSFMKLDISLASAVQEALSLLNE